MWVIGQRLLKHQFTSVAQSLKLQDTSSGQRFLLTAFWINLAPFSNVVANCSSMHFIFLFIHVNVQSRSHKKFVVKNVDRIFCFYQMTRQVICMGKTSYFY